MPWWVLLLLLASVLPSVASFAPPHLRVPRVGGADALLCCKVLRCGAVALAAKGKGGKVKVPYKEGAGGDGIPRTSLPVQTSTAAVAVVISAEDIKKKVEAAQKEVVKQQDSDTLENFVADFGARAPEEDVVLTGRMPSEWLEVDFTVCLGKGGYGDVYEARILDGPNKGSRAVAKRALAKKGKIRWHADGNSISTTTLAASTLTVPLSSKAASTSTPGASRSGSSSSDGRGNANEYLEVEDYVNRLITSNCPHIAAPYIGDCVQDGNRWLVWHFEENSSTLSDIISVAHTRGSMKPLAAALGIEGFKDGDTGLNQNDSICVRN